MLTQRKKQTVVLWGVVALFGAIGLVYWVKSANWVPLAIFSAGLIEWFINTLWARSAAKDQFLVTGVVAGINASATYIFVVITNLVIAHNPDGMLYVVVNLVAYGVGSGAGSMFAMRAFPKKQ
ncbi:MAG: hypothetical protein WCT40_02040 [Candidatus Magasanikbacteria bacterium]